jgi:hypothetical protein
MEPSLWELVEEKRDLDDKIDKLTSLIKSGSCADPCDRLSSNEENHRLRQHWFMRDYSAVLRDRIEGFKKRK